MTSFPYQIVGFLDHEPHIGESAYNSENGWYAQIALKRRFAIEGLSEAELIEKIEEFCGEHSKLVINVGKIARPEQMPVDVLEVEPIKELIDFHTRFIDFFGENITSRYPERDGDNYYPHITAEYNGNKVIDADKYSNKVFTLDHVWLLKDVEGTEDSLALKSFSLAN